MIADKRPKPLIDVAASLKNLRKFPKTVRQTMGQALFAAQLGEKHIDAKPLKGFKGAGVMEIVENHDTDTYRAVYTVRFEKAVYVVHAFKKKSKKGIKTPKQEIDLIKERLKVAQKDYQERFGSK